MLLKNSLILLHLFGLQPISQIVASTMKLQHPQPDVGFL